MSKDKPEFGEIPRKYNSLIQKTLEADLMVQAGREKDLPPMSLMEKKSVIAYQKAQNKVLAEERERHEAEMNKK